MTSSGDISGTPKQDGHFQLVFKVTDESGQHATRTEGMFIAGPTHTWSAEDAPMAGNNTGSAALAAVTCAAAGKCVAVGSESNEPLIETLSGGEWSAQTLALPPDSADAHYAALSAVTCPTVDTCVAVGRYQDVQANMKPLVERAVGGTWVPDSLLLPPDASTASGKQDAALVAVSCPSAVSCLAVGSYTVSDESQGLVEKLDVGAWTPTEIATSLPTRLDGITCLSSDSCFASGAVGLDQIVVARFRNGTWTQSIPPPPSELGPQLLGSTAPGCASEARCFVGLEGYARSSDGINQWEDFIETVGQDNTATAAYAPLPADGVRLGEHTAMLAMDCPSAGWCAAAGSYTDRDNHSQLLVETLNAQGEWSTPSGPIPLAINDPYDRLTGFDGWIRGLSCAGAGACTGVGDDEWDDGSALIATLQVGRWQVQRAPTPIFQIGQKVTKTYPAELWDVSCPTPDTCVAIGGYSDSNYTGHDYIATETS